MFPSLACMQIKTADCRLHALCVTECLHAKVKCQVSHLAVRRPGRVTQSAMEEDHGELSAYEKLRQANIEREQRPPAAHAPLTIVAPCGYLDCAIHRCPSARRQPAGTCSSWPSRGWHVDVATLCGNQGRAQARSARSQGLANVRQAYAGFRATATSAATLTWGAGTRVSGWRHLRARPQT